MELLATASRFLVGPIVFSLTIFWFSLVFFTLFPEVGRGAQRGLVLVEEVLASWFTPGRNRGSD